ncbi:MAG: M20/M25/M40 family metallo-hydrolase [Victivallales bacterium]|nr:M20/M25/M40 family metallo-hydrolase [Victivallales bacterium]
MIQQETIKSTIARLLPETQEFLCRAMRYPSTSGQEHELMQFLETAFQSESLQVERVPMSDELHNDPDYSDPVPNIKYNGRFNLRVFRPGTGAGRKLMFNAHTDVVPPSEGMDHAWNPYVENGTVFGRGACDDKGQVALIYLVLKTLEALDVELDSDLVAHLVNEEENGGNGSLAMVRTGEKADFCVVLEPSEGRLLTSIRGAVWFRLRFKGVAGHSGMAGQTKSALLLARDAIGMLEKYHAELLQASRGFPLFDPYPNPMPITFGKLQAGNWPAAAPNQAVLEGVLGFLPNKSKEDICREMREALLNGGLREDDFELTFMYRHDCSVIEPDHELPRLMRESAAAAGLPLEIDAMTASCDAWLYNNQLQIPTLVYGAGSLKVAHSVKECIAMSDLAASAATLVNFILQFGKAK